MSIISIRAARADGHQRVGMWTSAGGWTAGGRMGIMSISRRADEHHEQQAGGRASAGGRTSISRRADEHQRAGASISGPSAGRWMSLGGGWMGIMSISRRADGHHEHQQVAKN